MLTSITLDVRFGIAYSFAVIRALLQVVNVVVTTLTSDGVQTGDDGMLAPLIKSPVSNDENCKLDSDSWVDCDTAPV